MLSGGRLMVSESLHFRVEIHRDVWYTLPVKRTLVLILALT